MYTLRPGEDTAGSIPRKQCLASQLSTDKAHGCRVGLLKVQGTCACGPRKRICVEYTRVESGSQQERGISLEILVILLEELESPAWGSEEWRGSVRPFAEVGTRQAQ